MPRVAFIMEQQVGLGTHAANWAAAAPSLRDQAECLFYPVTYYDRSALLDRVRFVPRALRALWRCSRQVAAAMAQGPFDAVLCCTHNPAVVNPAPLRGGRGHLQFDVTPALLDGMAEHYANVHTSLGPRSALLDRLKAARVRGVLRSAATVLPWSTWAAASARDDYGISADRIHIAPPGVDTARWTPSAARRAGSPVRIVFTGYDLVRKGGDLLLRWAAETQATGWEMHLATRVPADAPSGVTFHTELRPNSRELRELVRSADLFVLPTRADCFSLASLEAMACGVPVVVGNVGGIPDIVEDGATGRLVAPGSYEALAEVLDDLVRDRGTREAMGRRAREVVCERFDAQRTLAAALSVMLA